MMCQAAAEAPNNAPARTAPSDCSLPSVATTMGDDELDTNPELTSDFAIQARQRHAGFPAVGIARKVIVLGANVTCRAGALTGGSTGSSSCGVRASARPFSSTTLLCNGCADNVNRCAGCGR